MDTFQFADIIILALIAGFIALRLRNTLGKDVGHRPDTTNLRRQMGKELEERVISMPGAKVAVESKEEEKLDKAFEALEGPAKAKVEKVKQKDASLDITEFLEGSKGAFEWVMKAFNDGDKSTLKQLLSKEVYKEFEEAMIDRESSAAKADATLVSIEEAELVDAEIKGSKVHMTMKFVSDQIHVVRNEEGELISGDASEITRVEDEWVFERGLTSRDPNWTIIDT
ncbi:MAG: Tim44/TimA family putative adaptor protein [Rickettsiales bacterium]|nr:Tim44/TimA family putative adaptor protein [Rickettsiales bacterium]